GGQTGGGRLPLGPLVYLFGNGALAGGQQNHIQAVAHRALFAPHRVRREANHAGAGRNGDRAVQDRAVSLRTAVGAAHLTTKRGAVPPGWSDGEAFALPAGHGAGAEIEIVEVSRRAG